jgi:hypothetical protein
MASAVPPTAAAATPSPLAALVLLLGVDLLVGIWLKLHHPQGIPIYLLINAPTLGVTSLVWRLLPKRAQEQVGESVAAGLVSGLTRLVLIFLAVGLGITSLFFGALHVSLVDPGTTAVLHVVRGSQRDAGNPTAIPVDSFRLDRLASSVVRLEAIGPQGGSFWLYSSSHVLYSDARSYPWFPADLAYPADFVPMSCVVVLPANRIMSRAAEHDLGLTLRAGVTSEIVARVPLDSVGLLVGFVSPGPFLSQDTARWGLSLDSIGAREPDPDFKRFRSYMLEKWRRAHWVPSTRPLRLGDTLSWEVRSLKDSSLIDSGRLTLNDRIADLHLSF